MKWSWGVFIYSLICNIPVCFFLCLTSSIIAASDLEGGTLYIKFTTISWSMFLINYGISFILAMCIGCFVPLTKIGRWFTALFRVENKTYTGNVPYRLLATLITSIIYYIIITPTLSLFNYFVLRATTIDQTLLNMAISAPLMLLVGFTSSLISDIFAFKVAHKVDPSL